MTMDQHPRLHHGERVALDPALKNSLRRLSKSRRSPAQRALDEHRYICPECETAARCPRGEILAQAVFGQRATDGRAS